MFYCFKHFNCRNSTTMERNYTLVLIQIMIFTSTLSQFCNKFKEKPLNYKLVKTDFYSKMPVLSRKVVANLQKCKQFAIEKRALAFNFGQYDSSKATFYDSPDDPFNANCVLLICPEINNFTNLAKVRGFAYYSVFHKKIWLEGNRTLSCVPKTGLFMVSDDKRNYTDARKSCQNLNGSLAHIASEIRTNHLAAIIGDNTTFYIGLSGEKEEKIWKNECNEPLYCFNYLAWGEGQPSRSYGCAILTRLDTNSNPFWGVVSCNKELHYICEISSTYHPGNNTIRPNCQTGPIRRTREFFINTSSNPNNKKKRT